MTAMVLAVSEQSAEAILSGKRRADVRRFRPARLPARAYLALVGAGAIVGECVLGQAERRGDAWALPVSRPRRYKRPRPLASVGLAKTPRSFRYVDPSASTVDRSASAVNSPASTRTRCA